MKRFDNDIAASGLVAGILIFIIVVVGSMGFIWISSTFESQYKESSADPVNSTGIYLNNTSTYKSVDTISKGISQSVPAAILVAFLLAALILVFLVWAMLKRGD